jgi:serpin B
MNKFRYLSLLLAVVLIEGVSSAPLQAQILWPWMQVGQPPQRATATVHNQTGVTVKVFANNRYMFDLPNNKRRDLIYPIGRLNLSAKLPNGVWIPFKGFHNRDFSWRLMPFPGGQQPAGPKPGVVIIEMQIRNNTGEALKLVHNGKVLDANVPVGISNYKVPAGQHQLTATLLQSEETHELIINHSQNFSWPLGPISLPIPPVKPRPEGSVAEPKAEQLLKEKENGSEKDAGRRLSQPKLIGPDSQLSSTFDMLRDTKLMALVQGNQHFSCDLYRQLASQQEGNLAFSPHSISTALMMTLAGAGPESKTKEQMRQVLRQTLFGEQLHESAGKLRVRLQRSQNSNHTQLLSANRLWCQQGTSFKASFLENMQRNYGAEPAQLDFVRQPQQARQIINAWVAWKTGDAVRQLLGPEAISAETQLVLTNAVSFQGKWSQAFSRESTSVQLFQASNTRSIPIAMMQQTNRFLYAEDDRLQVIEIPYGQQNELSLVVFLPRKMDGYRELEENLSAVMIDRWLSQLRDKEVEFQLPKFQLDSRFALVGALKSLGMKRPFTEGEADFSGIDGKRDHVLKDVLHQTVIQVSEEGTTAFAATAPIISKVSMRLYQGPKFHANHPFLFLIRDRKTGTLLFMGRLTDPTPTPLHWRRVD